MPRFLYNQTSVFYSNIIYYNFILQGSHCLYLFSCFVFLVFHFNCKYIYMLKFLMLLHFITLHYIMKGKNISKKLVNACTISFNGLLQFLSNGYLSLKKIRI